MKGALTNENLATVTRVVERLLLSSAVALAALSAIKYKEAVFMDPVTGYLSVITMVLISGWVGWVAMDDLIQMVPESRAIPFTRRLLMAPIVLLAVLASLYFWRALITVGIATM